MIFLSNYHDLRDKSSRMNLFHYSQYQKYLSDHVTEVSKQKTGYKARLAKAAKVHPSFMSRVLSGSVQLTPDQALLLCKFFGFSDEETEYFSLLVSNERASEPEYKEFLKKKIELFRQKQEDELGNQLSAMLSAHG